MPTRAKRFLSAVITSLTDRLPPVAVQCLFIVLSPLLQIVFAWRVAATALRFFGPMAYAAWAVRMARLRYRAPSRDLRMLAPGPMSAGMLLICAVVLYFGPRTIASHGSVLIPAALLGFSFR